MGTVELLLHQGALVVGGDLNQSPTQHDNLTFQQTNVASWADLVSLFKLATSKHGRIDHVFVNAGISGRTNLLEEQLDENGDLLEPNHSVWDINLKGAVNTVALAIHYLRQRDTDGSIVMTASASSWQRFRLPDYTSAKHGVLGLMRGLVPILSPNLPIRINSIGPSWTNTGLVPDGVIEQLTGMSVNTTAQVAESVALLMSDKKRHGEFIYTVEGAHMEIEGTLLNTAAEIAGSPSEDEVMAKIFKEMESSAAARKAAESALKTNE